MKFDFFYDVGVENDILEALRKVFHTYMVFIQFQACLWFQGV